MIIIMYLSNQCSWQILCWSQSLSSLQSKHVWPLFQWIQWLHHPIWSDISSWNRKSVLSWNRPYCNLFFLTMVVSNISAIFSHWVDDTKEPLQIILLLVNLYSRNVFIKIVLINHRTVARIGRIKVWVN